MFDNCYKCDPDLKKTVLENESPDLSRPPTEQYDYSGESALWTKKHTMSIPIFNNLDYLFERMFLT